MTSHGGGPDEAGSGDRALWRQGGRCWRGSQNRPPLHVAPEGQGGGMMLQRQAGGPGRRQDHAPGQRTQVEDTWQDWRSTCTASRAIILREEPVLCEHTLGYQLECPEPGARESGCPVPGLPLAGPAAGCGAVTEVCRRTPDSSAVSSGAQWPMSGTERAELEVMQPELLT